MATTLEAIYENGVLRLANPLPFPNHSRVSVTVQALDEDPERKWWLNESEAALSKTWDNPVDDVFNVLLQK
jgi:predicted DNA-binding antitoxin AbrB/MazE fold protein